MRAKNLALRVLSTAAMLSIVTSIAAPAFAATYYINDGSVDVKVSEDGVVTVEQGDVTYKDGLGSVVIRGGTRGNKDDDRVKADASPATQEADGSNTPAGNETEAPKSENTAGDTAPKPVTTAAGERKEGTPQQEPTEEEAEEKVTPEQKPTEKEAEEKVTPEPAKAKAEAPKPTQEPSAEQEEEKQEKEDEPTVPAAPAAQADNSSTSTSAERTDNVITIVNNFAKKAEQVFSFVLDNVNIDRSEDYYGHRKAALTVKGNGDTEIELDGDNILKGGYDHAGLEKNDSDGTGTLTIKDDHKAADGSKGSLLAKGGYNGAGIGGGECQDTSHITVTGGNITAVSGRFAAGIGGGDSSNGTDITIKGDATVIASGDAGAGIGGGGDGGNYTKGYGKVTITDHANVKAMSEFGSGIGGGREAGGDITISGDATVAAENFNGGTAIGSGGWLHFTSGNSDNYNRLNTNITICDRANVTAVGSGFHPAIGSQGYVPSFDGVSHPFTTTINILGGTLNVINRGDNQGTSDFPAIGNGTADGANTNADLVLNINASTGNTVINAYTTGSNAATIGKGSTLKKDDEQIQYNADGSSKFGEAGSVILHLFKKAIANESNHQIENWFGIKHPLHEIDITKGELYDTLHNAQWLKDNGYTSELADTTHAWMVDDTKEQVKPTPEHEGHVYYKCSVPGCKAVHDEVLPKLEPKPTPEPTPDPTPVQPEPTPVPTPEPTPVQPEPAPVQPDTPADTQNTAKDDVSTPKLYVIDLANTQVLFDETRQNDTVTYTTKQDGASLTGSFEALEAMAADGVKTIVFQTIGTNTPGAVSRVSVDALLQHGGETLLLTHNGTEVHLTIDGQNADGLLLQ